MPMPKWIVPADGSMPGWYVATDPQGHPLVNRPGEPEAAAWAALRANAARGGPRRPQPARKAIQGRR